MENVVSFSLHSAPSAPAQAGTLPPTAGRRVPPRHTHRLQHHVHSLRSRPVAHQVLPKCHGRQSKSNHAHRVEAGQKRAPGSLCIVNRSKIHAQTMGQQPRGRPTHAQQVSRQLQHAGSCLQQHRHQQHEEHHEQRRPGGGGLAAALAMLLPLQLDLVGLGRLKPAQRGGEGRGGCLG
jgi:hypothetical protein